MTEWPSGLSDHFMRSSVTRFGEISPLWHNFKSLWLFLRVNFVLGKILNLIGQIFMMFDEFSLLLMAQY